MAKTLVMTFKTEEGKKSTISLNNVREDLTGEEANSVMDTIISKNIFQTSSGDLVRKESAELVERVSQKVQL